MPYVYILKCADGTFYTGSTWDIERRFWEHQNRVGANYTRERLPVVLVFCEECARIEDAFHREKQIQGWSHKKKLSLVSGKNNQLPELSICINETHSRNVILDNTNKE